MRVKKGVHAAKRRRNVLKDAKGYHLGRSSKEKEAKQAVTRAGVNAFAHRRKKKSDFRRLWQIRIGAALRETDFSYSRFIDALTKKKVGVDRKILSDLAQNNPESFKKVVEKVS